jgi:hypothetical protein
VAAAVRPAAAADADQIAAVHVAAWQWAYAGLLPAEELGRVARRAGLDPCPALGAAGQRAGPALLRALRLAGDLDEVRYERALVPATGSAARGTLPS